MTGTGTTTPLDHWNEVVTEIPEHGRERTRQVSPEERCALVTALGVVDVPHLEVRYRIVSRSGGGYRLTGELSAEVVQACVVTLEPVAETIAEHFEVEFWPEPQERPGTSDLSVLSGPDLEPLENGSVPSGRIVFETLSAALDPYPRKAGAEFGWQYQGEQNNNGLNPFAVLAKLKDKR